jgi:hypothetical protein
MTHTLFYHLITNEYMLYTPISFFRLISSFFLTYFLFPLHTSQRGDIDLRLPELCYEA